MSDELSAFGLLLAVLAMAAGLLSWLPRKKRERALKQPFPAAHLALLERALPQYAHMPAPLQQQLQRLVQRFLLEKKFVGCAGMDITDEVRISIAARACLLLLGREAALFPRLAFVLVYPAAFVVPHTVVDEAGLVTHSEETMLGESWDEDRVLLAWDHVAHQYAEHGHDVVLHEFAHQLDTEDGSANGAPRLASKAQYQRWARVLGGEFERLQQADERDEDTLLDPYGAQHPAEFFAVATEAFFGLPHALAEEHPELYAALQDYYCVDPRQWELAAGN